MKNRFVLCVGAAVMLTTAFAWNPQTLADGRSVLAAVWEAARPPRGVTASFYFHQKQWLADARTLASTLNYLYESTPEEPAAPGFLTRGEAQLLTRADHSSNGPASHGLTRIDSI